MGQRGILKGGRKIAGTTETKVDDFSIKTLQK